MQESGTKRHVHAPAKRKATLKASAVKNVHGGHVTAMAFGHNPNAGAFAVRRGWKRRIVPNVVIPKTWIVASTVGLTLKCVDVDAKEVGRVFSADSVQEKRNRQKG